MSDTMPTFKTTKINGGVAITGVDVNSLGAAVDLVIPSTIEGQPVVEIANSAFKGCSPITSAVIPESVKTIGVEAFQYCFALSRVVISSGVQAICNNAFSGCSSLTSVFIPGSIHTIGDLAFSYCQSLHDVEIPKSVKEIGRGVFEGCSVKVRCYERSYTERWVKENNIDFEIVRYSPKPVNIIDNTDRCSREQVLPEPTIRVVQNVRYETERVKGGVAITGVDVASLGNVTDLVIPSTIDGLRVVKIAERAFSGCTSLTGVVISNSVQSIGEYVFSDCSSLTSVVIPNSVQLISKGAFSGCSSLTNVIISNGVQYIDKWAFSECSLLTSVVIPNSVQLISKGAFSGCSSLTSVVIPNSVQLISKGAFFGCSSLTSVVVPQYVSGIGDGAFPFFTKLRVYKGSYAERWAKKNNVDYEIVHYSPKPVNITDNTNRCSREQVLPEPTIRVAQNVRYETERVKGGVAITGVDVASLGNVTDLVIPSTIDGLRVVKIAERAFSGCTSLTGVVISNSVQSIGEYVFSDCSSLTSVVIPNSVQLISKGAFFGCSSLTNVIISNGVQYIDKWAFSECSLLTSVVIPNSVQSIGDSAFSGCSSLKSVVVPRYVSGIGWFPFPSSTKLRVYKGSYPEQWAIKYNHKYEIIQ